MQAEVGMRGARDSSAETGSCLQGRRIVMAVGTAQSPRLTDPFGLDLVDIQTRDQKPAKPHATVCIISNHM